MGLGSQDSLDEALEFVDRHELTITMLWDETLRSWSELGVSSQPASALFAADGALLGAWLGAIPEDEVLDLIGT